ncbi:MAG: hypothetical protein JRM80_06485 [Nitrososphaerota archaeon]|nr:hypothetical protein [Nitrososphaerota archaeon]
MTPLELQLADGSGVAALLLLGASSAFIAFRRRLLLGGTKLATVRWTHFALSLGAAAALALHVSLLVGFPLTNGVILGYGAFAAGTAVWLTGSAFVERVRDSLVFHGQLTIVLLALILAHAATTSAVLSPITPVVLASIAVVAVLNGGYHISKMRETLR